MPLPDLFAWTGEPGTIGVMLLVAWRLGALERAALLLARRVLELESNPTAMREFKDRRHA